MFVITSQRYPQLACPFQLFRLQGIRPKGSLDYGSHARCKDLRTTRGTKWVFLLVTWSINVGSRTKNWLVGRGEDLINGNSVRQRHELGPLTWDEQNCVLCLCTRVETVPRTDTLVKLLVDTDFPALVCLQTDLTVALRLPGLPVNLATETKTM